MIRTKGATDQSVTIRIIDETDGTPETAVEHDTAGIALWYRREGETQTAITEAALATLDAAHADGGIEHIGDGYYRLDLPDAAFAAGADYVEYGGTVTGMIVVGGVVDLLDADLYDGVRAGLTALPNAAAGSASGLPIQSDLATESEVVTELMATAVDGTVTYKTTIQAIAAVLAGKTSGGGLTFRDLADTLNRVAATVDGSNNRTAVTITAD